MQSLIFHNFTFSKFQSFFNGSRPTRPLSFLTASRRPGKVWLLKILGAPTYCPTLICGLNLSWKHITWAFESIFRSRRRSWFCRSKSTRREPIRTHHLTFTNSVDNNTLGQSPSLTFQKCKFQATSQMLRRPSHFTRAQQDMSRPVLQVKRASNYWKMSLHQPQSWMKVKVVKVQPSLLGTAGTEESRPAYGLCTWVVGGQVLVRFPNPLALGSEWKQVSRRTWLLD